MKDHMLLFVSLYICLMNSWSTFKKVTKKQLYLELMHDRQTHLTALFKLNRLDENARQYLYTEIPFGSYRLRNPCISAGG